MKKSTMTLMLIGILVAIVFMMLSDGGNSDAAPTPDPSVNNSHNTTEVTEVNVVKFEGICIAILKGDCDQRQGSTVNGNVDFGTNAETNNTEVSPKILSNENGTQFGVDNSNGN